MLRAQQVEPYCWEGYQPRSAASADVPRIARQLPSHALEIFLGAYNNAPQIMPSAGRKRRKKSPIRRSSRNHS